MLGTQMIGGNIPMNVVFSPQLDSMKIGTKTKTLRLFTATRSWRATCSLLTAVVFVLLSGLQLQAQNVVLTGAIGGRVTDQTGASVPGATILVRNLATGLQHSAATNHAGLYQFLALMPGTYSVTATGTGFHDVEALVRVLVGNITLQDLRLEVGVGGETVKVSGDDAPVAACGILGQHGAGPVFH